MRQGEEISLTRGTHRAFSRSAGSGVCDACKDREYKDAEPLLEVETESVKIYLCAVHEGMLLDKLLTNYLKRAARRKTIGFTGFLEKHKEAEASSEPS